MTSFVLSALESIVCVQPLKIVFTAIFIALVMKTINWGDSKENPDPELEGEVKAIRKQANELSSSLSGMSKF